MRDGAKNRCSTVEHDISKMYWARYVLVDQALRDGGMRSTECHSCCDCDHLNPGPATNCLHRVLQAGWCINVRAVTRMDVKLGVQSASMSWWALKTPKRPSRRVGKPSLAPWRNSKFLHRIPASVASHPGLKPKPRNCFSRIDALYRVHECDHYSKTILKK